MKETRSSLCRSICKYIDPEGSINEATFNLPQLCKGNSKILHDCKIGLASVFYGMHGSLVYGRMYVTHNFWVIN